MLYFPYKMRLQDGTSTVSEAAGARCRFHGRIILGFFSNRLYIGGSNSGISRLCSSSHNFVAGVCEELQP